MWISLLSHFIPPPIYTLCGKLGRVIGDADAYPPFIAGKVIDSIRDSLPNILFRKIMRFHLHGISTGTPFSANILKFSHQFLLFCVNGYRWLIVFYKNRNLIVYILELIISVRMLR